MYELIMDELKREKSQEYLKSFFNNSISSNKDELFFISISSSRYFFNYRHTSNIFSLTSTVHNLGLTKENIIMLDANDILHHPLNIYKGHVVFGEEEDRDDFPFYLQHLIKKKVNTNIENQLNEKEQVFLDLFNKKYEQRKQSFSMNSKKIDKTMISDKPLKKKFYYDLFDLPSYLYPESNRPILFRGGEVNEDNLRKFLIKKKNHGAFLQFYQNNIEKFNKRDDYEEAINLMRLTPTSTSQSQSLSSSLSTTSNSLVNLNKVKNLVMFLTGHSGEEFFKFHDKEEMDTTEFFSFFLELYWMDKYENLIIILDTCHGITIINKLKEFEDNFKETMRENGTIKNFPSIIILSSSDASENSYSYYSNSNLGVSIIDRFSYALIKYMEYKFNKLLFIQSFFNKELKLMDDLNLLFSSVKPQDLLKELKLLKSLTFQDLYSSFNRNFLYSTPQIYKTFSSPSLSSLSLGELFSDYSNLKSTYLIYNDLYNEHLREVKKNQEEKNSSIYDSYFNYYNYKRISEFNSYYLFNNNHLFENHLLSGQEGSFDSIEVDSSQYDFSSFLSTSIIRSEASSMLSDPIYSLLVTSSLVDSIPVSEDTLQSSLNYLNQIKMNIFSSPEPFDPSSLSSFLVQDKNGVIYLSNVSFYFLFFLLFLFFFFIYNIFKIITSLVRKN